MNVVYDIATGRIIAAGPSPLTAEEGQAVASFPKNPPPYPFPDGWRVETVHRLVAPGNQVAAIGDVSRFTIAKPPQEPPRLIPVAEMSSRPTLWFITPAYQRLELSRICFAQRAAACETLRTLGVDAQALVVADDENLDLAQEAGLLTLEAPNRLGQRFNDAYEHAARNGIDYLSPIGSDTWSDPNRYLALPPEGVVMGTCNFSVVEETGQRRATLRIGYEGGVGRVFRTDLLSPVGYRPLQDHRARGCDTTTLRAVNMRRRNDPIRFAYTDLHPLEILGFQSADVQITPYERLVGRWLADETRRPFAGLSRYYPAGLVERVEAHYRVAVPA